MIRNIVLADQPIIRRKLKLVQTFDEGLVSLVQDLKDTMIFANGAGLAANQIGVDAQVFTTGVGTKVQVFINPKLKILSSRTDQLEEGCLSVPGYRGLVGRASQVEIAFDDVGGRRKKLRATGYLARVLQHEYDHLQGRLYLDHISDPKLIEKVTPVKVAFFGSGQFAIPTLVTLTGLNWTFDFLTVGVVTQPARPVGRSQKLQPTPVYEVAQRFGLPTITPEKLDQSVLKTLKQWHVELVVLADYGKILPATLLSLPKFGALNIHPSLLPRHRGAAPIQHTLLSDDKETGVTLIRMNPQVDAGDIIAQYRIKVSPSDTYVILSDKLSQLGALILRDHLAHYVFGEIKLKPQPKRGQTAAPKISPEMGLVAPTDTPAQIERKVRALSPEPGVYTVWEGKRVKILAAHLKKGRLVLDRLQMEGGKPLSWQDFKNGYPRFSLPSNRGL